MKSYYLTTKVKKKKKVRKENTFADVHCPEVQLRLSSLLHTTHWLNLVK